MFFINYTNNTNKTKIYENNDNIINSYYHSENDIENQLNFIISKKKVLEYYKENFIKEFKYLLLNGFYMYLINIDFYPVFIYSDYSFKYLYFDISFQSLHKLNQFVISQKNLFLYYLNYSINNTNLKITLSIPLSKFNHYIIHCFYKKNNFDYSPFNLYDIPYPSNKILFFTLFSNLFHISLYHPDYFIYDILYDGLLLLLI